MKYSQKRKLVKYRKKWRKNQRKIQISTLLLLFLFVVTPFLIAAVSAPNRSLEIKQTYYTTDNLCDLTFPQYYDFMRKNYKIKVTREQHLAFKAKHCKN